MQPLWSQVSFFSIFIMVDAICYRINCRYDYILQLEQISDELQFVLSKILDRNWDFAPPQQPSDKQPRQKLMNYLRQVPANLSLAVFQLYRDDFETFGYEMPSNEQELKEFIDES